MPAPASYSRTQIGWWMLAALGASTIIAIGPLAAMRGGRHPMSNETTRVVIAIIAVTIVATALLFSSLTVRVTSESLTWRFGPGLLRFSVPLADVAAVSPARTSLLAGIGIHYIGSGWVYNVSGRGAVEITRRDGRKIWIGSEEPEALAAAIEKARSAVASPGAPRR